MNIACEQPRNENITSKDIANISPDDLETKCIVEEEDIKIDYVVREDTPSIQRCNLTKIWSSDKVKLKRKSSNCDIGVKLKSSRLMTDFNQSHFLQSTSMESRKRNQDSLKNESVNKIFGTKSASSIFRKTDVDDSSVERTDRKPHNYYRSWEDRFEKKLHNNHSDVKVSVKTREVGINSKRCDFLSKIIPKKFDLSSDVKKKKNTKVRNDKKSSCKYDESNIKQGDSQYSCDACGRKYASHESLILHLRSIHFEAENKDCEICGKSFTWKSELNYHKEVEHPESSDKPFSCTQCGKRFYIRGHLDVHIRSHNNEFKCSICNVNLSSYVSLVQHTRKKHTGETPFSCLVCERSWTSKCELKSHIRSVHLRERKFKCDRCNKSFFRKATLNQHILRHDKNLCSFCGIKFNGNYAYETHLPNCLGKQRKTALDLFSSTKFEQMCRK